MNLNQTIICGNLTKDPELRSLPSGQQVCEFTVATHRVFLSKGEKQEETEFHNVVAWGKQAEIVAKYAKKGTLVLVRGRLKTRTWDDKNGSKQYKTEIHADLFELGPKQGRAARPFRNGPRRKRSRPDAVFLKHNHQEHQEI
jgi:single-strand DNA-binding protein